MYYNEMLQLTCEHCEMDYEAQTAKSRYCSGKCRTAASRYRAKMRRELEAMNIEPSERIMSNQHIRQLDRIRGYSWNAANKIHELQRATNAEVAEKAIEALHQLLFDLNIPE